MSTQCVPTAAHAATRGSANFKKGPTAQITTLIRRTRASNTAAESVWTLARSIEGGCNEGNDCFSSSSFFRFRPASATRSGGAAGSVWEAESRYSLINFPVNPVAPKTHTSNSFVALCFMWLIERSIRNGVHQSKKGLQKWSPKHTLLGGTPSQAFEDQKKLWLGQSRLQQEDLWRVPSFRGNPPF